MSFLDELLATRRSIRKYTAAPVPEAWIAPLVHAATLSPSSGNSQPVRIIRIGAPEGRAKLQEAMEKGRQGFLAQAEAADKPNKMRNWINAYYRFSRFMVDAPLLLAIGTVAAGSGLSRALAEAGLIVPGKRWETDGDIAVGLALQGMTLKAQELGLGSCILTAPLVFITRVEELLGLTDLEIKCFLALGFPAESPASPPKKDLGQIYREL